MEDKRLDKREEDLQKRLEDLKKLEAEVKKAEKEVKARERAKKQVLLRLSPSLWGEISKWADEDFRSINGQIEFLLTEAIRQRKK